MPIARYTPNLASEVSDKVATSKLHMFLFRFICLSLIFICFEDYVVAQEREPDIRIRLPQDHGMGDDMRFSKDGNYLILIGTSSIWRYDLVQRRYDSKLTFPHTPTSTVSI